MLWLVFVLALARSQSCEATIEAAAYLSTEYSKPPTPFPIDTPFPRLHWVPQTTDRAQTQTAYQVLFATTQNVTACDSTNTCVWDSGKVASSANTIVYNGPALKDDTTYYWIVRWWDSNDNQSPDSEVAKVDVALVNEYFWVPAAWIGDLSINIMRSEFEVPAGLVQVRAYVSALGWGQFYVNGNLMDVGTLGVGWTRYDSRVLYLMYDITNTVSAGANAAGVMLGHGWKDDRSYPANDPGDVADHVTVLMLQVIGTFANGTKTILLSSNPNTWTGTQGPIIDSSIYNGETYDATLEQDGWNTVGFANASAWSPVPLYPNFSPIFSVQSMPLIQVVREVAPVSVTEPQPGIFVVDFGENLSGYCRISAVGSRGTQFNLHHAEALMHPPYGASNGLLYFDNLRSALATDTYTMRGNPAGETYTPRFTYHGFRYVQIAGYPGTLTADNITMLHVRTAVEPRTNVSFSSLILNQIQYNAVTGQASNLMSVPTDCDQRDERLGWMGDAGLSADSMTLNFQLESLHENYLRNIEDEINQTTFSIPDVVPFVRYGGRPADPSWSAAFPQLVWSQFKYLNNLYLANEHYPSLQNYLQNLANQVSAAGGLANWPTPYGDWVPPNNNLKVSGPFTSAYNYLVTISQVQEIAQALGKTADAQALQQLFAQVAAEFNQAFITNGSYANAQQIAMALPLLLDIVPESLNSTALFEALIYDIEVVNTYHVTTGIIGLKGLYPALSENGRMDIALALAEQVDYPSLGYMAFNDQEPANGNLWELWDANSGDPGMDSRNHHMFSSPSAWHLELAGLTQIRHDGLSPSLYLEAATTLGLSAANVSAISSQGLVTFNWQRHGGTQCAKSPENQGKVNPALPLHVPLVLSCGSAGGVISQITFASFGVPIGYCGNFAINPNCHMANSSSVIESLCVGQPSCEIPTTTDFWSDPCFGVIKRLFVQAECSLDDAVTATVGVPVGVTAQVMLPNYGVQPVVTESGSAIWEAGNYISGVPGVLAATSTPEGIHVTVASGDYDFVLSGTS